MSIEHELGEFGEPPANPDEQAAAESLDHWIEAVAQGVEPCPADGSGSDGFHHDLNRSLASLWDAAASLWEHGQSVQGDSVPSASGHHSAELPDPFAAARGVVGRKRRAALGLRSVSNHLRAQFVDAAPLPSTTSGSAILEFAGCPQPDRP